jgi:hypothetical protein
MKIRRTQMIKSLVFTAIAATPGAIWLYNAGTTQSLVITCLGSLVGFGLSLPGVSARRVAGGTIGMIAMNNLPHSIGHKVFDKLTSDGAPAEGKEDHPEPENRWGD